MSLLTLYIPTFEVTDEVREAAGKFVDLGQSLGNDVKVRARDSVAVKGAIWFALCALDGGLMNGMVTVTEED